VGSTHQADAEQQLLAAIDDQETLAVLSALISVPSEGGSQGEADIQRQAADRLADLGLEVDLWPLDLDELRRAADYPGEEVARNQAWGLVGTSHGGGQPALILQGHLDVVPPGDRSAWSQDPYEPRVADGSVRGRGSCDMKGGTAALLGAVSAVVRSGVPLTRRYAVHLVIGEEDGGIGAFATLRRGHGGASCVIPEPTNLELVTATAGALSFRIEVPGLATHGGTRYAGSSALDSYLALHAALQRLEARRNVDPEPLLRHLPIAYPLSVGRITGGDWASTVPDLVVVEGRYGLRISEDPDEARRELEAAVAEAAAGDAYLKDHPPRVSWPGGQFRGGHLAPDSGLRDLVGRSHADVTGGPPPPERGGPYGSDLRHYAAAGIPTLHYGPGDVRLAHGPDESVPLDQLAIAARVLALVLLRTCSP
jgi:acetylornithine deacetylase